MTINLSFDGNLTADPELRFTPSGAAVVNFTVAHTPGHFDRQKNEWVDDETIFLRCSMWREAAENVSESLIRGTAVLVSGRLQSRSYETKEGEKRTVLEVSVDNIGPSLKRATAKVTKTERKQGGGQQAEDPWASGTSQGQQGGWGQQPAAANAGGGWGGSQQRDEPPFAYPATVIGGA